MPLRRSRRISGSTESTPVAPSTTSATRPAAASADRPRAPGSGSTSQPSVNGGTTTPASGRATAPRPEPAGQTGGDHENAQARVRGEHRDLPAEALQPQRARAARAASAGPPLPATADGRGRQQQPDHGGQQREPGDHRGALLGRAARPGRSTDWSAVTVSPAAVERVDDRRAALGRETTPGTRPAGWRPRRSGGPRPGRRAPRRGRARAAPPRCRRPGPALGNRRARTTPGSANCHVFGGGPARMAGIGSALSTA